MPLLRDELRRPLIAAMESLDAVLALWEDGSASFGRSDTFSDIDFAAIVKEGQVECAAEAARLALSRVGAIAREYRQPTYHGDAQFFWQMEAASPFNFVDFTLIERRPEAFRIDRGIHGDPIIHFDKCGCLAVVEEDPGGRQARIREGVERIAAVAELQPLLVRKYLLRNEPLHALGAYQRWIIHPLIELLRMKHCPGRSSFHTTYLMYDLPSSVTEKLAPLMMTDGMEAIARKLPLASAWISELIEQLRQESAS